MWTQHNGHNLYCKWWSDSVCQKVTRSLNIFWSGTDLILLLILLILGRPLQKSLRLSRFKWDRDKTWQDFPPSKYASHDRVGFSVWCHTFKMVEMTSFHAEKCCHRVSELNTKCLLHTYAAVSCISWSMVHLYLLSISFLKNQHTLARTERRHHKVQSICKDGTVRRASLAVYQNMTAR